MFCLSLLPIAASYSPSDSEIEFIISNMTLKEKVGQMI
jgi:hypothetical protein